MASLAQSIVNRDVNLGVISTLLTLTTVTFVIRTAILLKQLRFHVHDYILTAAFLSMIAACGIYMECVSNIYRFNDALKGEAPLPTDFSQLLSRTVLYGYIEETLSWASIFFVKFSFLFMFRPLVQRQQPLTILWWVSVILCVPVTALSTAAPWILCPYGTSDSLLTCTTNFTFLHEENSMLYYSVTADAITDALVVSIPISLLHRTTLSTRQKLSIGTFLCLSCVMIAIALLRGISTRVYGTGDQIWNLFWVQFECCIAVMMASLSAFRQLYVVNARASLRRSGREDIARCRRKNEFDTKSSSLREADLRATIMGTTTVIEASQRVETDSVYVTASMDASYDGTPQGVGREHVQPSTAL